MPTLSHLIDDRELLDFSQNFGVQRSYMGSRLFPDVKTEYIEQEYTRLCENGNLPMAATVHALDTEAVIGSRVPFDKVSTEELLIKEKINLSEDVARLTRGLSMKKDSLRNFIFDDVARMSERVVTRAELAKMDAIAKGKFIIDENNLDLHIDYGIPAGNYVSSDWTDPDADILGDIRTWYDLATDQGVAPNIAITTNAVFRNIAQNKGIQKAIFGANGVGTLPSREQVNALLSSQFNGLTLTTNDQKYGKIMTASDKTYVEPRRFFPEDTFVLTATGVDGTLGSGLWGVTPEELEQGGAFDTKRQNQFVTVTTWDTPDPVATWTKASGLFIPVLPNVYGHIIADVSKLTLDEMDVDQLKAYAAKHNISITGKTTKAEILAAIKAAENNEG